MKTKQKIERMIKQIESDFYSMQQIDNSSPSWLYSPHLAAFNKLRKDIHNTVDFIERFTPAKEREEKYHEIMITLSNCNYSMKIENERRKELAQ